MRIISRKTLKDFWLKHEDAENPLKAWFADAKGAKWNTPMDIKKNYRNASFLSENRVVFNIKGNQYRLIVAVHYNFGLLYIRFIGTHQEYDKINANEI
jgi:mRNA interferase HigB